MEEVQLDHIIILIPYQGLLDLPKWVTANFRITPGGTHADGKTANKLICFQDGSYIELIAFVNDDPRNRDGHWWGQKQPGIIDWALTTTNESATAHYDAMRKRLPRGDDDSAVRYAPPRPGGRMRPDGREVRWEVTFPEDVTRGELPFFCHDVTPRELRVPFLEEENVEHPCTAYGVKGLSIVVPPGRAGELAEKYSAIVGADNESDVPGTGVFTVGSVRKVENARGPRLHVQGPSERDEEQRKGLEAKGGLLLGDLVLGGTGSDGFKGSKRMDWERDMGRIILKT